MSEPSVNPVCQLPSSFCQLTIGRDDDAIPAEGYLGSGSKHPRTEPRLVAGFIGFSRSQDPEPGVESITTCVRW